MIASIFNKVDINTAPLLERVIPRTLNNIEKIILVALTCIVVAVAYYLFTRKNTPDLPPKGVNPPKVAPLPGKVKVVPLPVEVIVAPPPEKVKVAPLPEKVKVAPLPAEEIEPRVEALGANGCIIRNVDPTLPNLFPLFNEETNEYASLTPMGVVILDLDTNEMTVKAREDNSPLPNTSEAYKKRLKEAALKVRAHILASGLLQQHIEAGNNTLVIDFTYNRKRGAVINFHADRVGENHLLELYEKAPNHRSNARWSAVDYKDRTRVPKQGTNDVLMFVYNDGKGPLVPTLAFEAKGDNPIQAQRTVFTNAAASGDVQFFRDRKDTSYYPTNLRPLKDAYLFNNRKTIHVSPTRTTIAALDEKQDLKKVFLPKPTGIQLYIDEVHERGFIRFAVSAVYVPK